jgi:adenine-specific DNA-methyltransferase
VIKYIGSKRTLVPTLVEIATAFPELVSVADVFSGTSRVGHAFKRAGMRVVANDHNAFAHALAQCYVATDLERVERRAPRLLAELAALPGTPGYFTQTFCHEARFFQPHNGERIDAIRERIATLDLDPELHAVALVSLMEAADRVDSTCGLQMAYVKKWAPRSFAPLDLRMPEVLPASPHGPCRALQLDANAAVRELDVDLAYIDPPYNQHSYLSNYHVWESLVRWDKPEVYGIARKRIDCRERKSEYNSKRTHDAAFDDLVAACTAPLMVVSFNNEGYRSRPQMEATLSQHGDVFVVRRGFKRYVGAQIGVYNPGGEVVGKISHLRNEEYIYLVARPTIHARVRDAFARLSDLTMRISDPEDDKTDEGRTTAVARVLALHGERTAEELRVQTGLSAHQTRMALQELITRGVAQRRSARGTTRYALSRDDDTISRTCEPS